MDKDEQRILDESRKAREQELEKLEKDTRQRMEWLIEYPEAGINLEDDMATTLDKTKKAEGQRRALETEAQKALIAQRKGEDLLSVSEAQSLGVPYGTTKQQATKMGITPRKESKTILTQTQINTFANAGVPQEMALIIQQDRNSGFSWEQIQENFAKQLGNEVNARTMITNFRKVAERQQSALDILYQLAQ